VPPARRRSTRPWLIAGAVALVAAAATALVVALLPSDPPGGAPDPGPAGGTRIAQFHYEFTAPEGWEQSGSNAESRETDLTPVGAPDDPGKIIVQEVELAYDATADRQRAVGELRDQYEGRRSRDNPPSVGGFDESATFAGRDVLYYNETLDAGTVDWYVILQGRYQVSVGCQHGETGTDRVRAACEGVVRTLTVHS
jgi:molecular chaperone DnaK